MVKRPRQVMRYSPSAGKHTLHTVERVKKKRASELRWGQRRFRRVMAGYRGFPRPKPDGREKPTKRVNILYRCTETGKAHYAPCKRAKNSNSSTAEVPNMTNQFLRVSCRDCGSESIIFSRATTSIACGVCSATLTKPAGGKADLVGCTVVEALN